MWAFASLIILATGACGGGSDAPAPSAAPAAPPAAVDPATAGSVMGMVTLEGTPPAPEEIRMNSDPACVELAGDTQTEYYAVGGEGGLGNVFVYVKNVEGSFPVPSETVTLDQKGCRYTPHVFGVRVGQTLEIINSDSTLHNIHATPAANDEFNTGQPIQGMRFERTFDSPEVMVPFKCDVHGWMNAYVGVLEHPFFSVTGEDGKFDISGLPPGQYEVEAWHEMLGTQTQNVTVGEGATAELSFTFTAG
jgi:plastocyanin